MTMTEVSLPARTYRRIDQVAKLAGVALVAVGLELGGDSATGLALGLCGVALATCTIWIENNE